MTLDTEYAKQTRNSLLELAQEAEDMGRLQEFVFTMAILAGQVGHRLGAIGAPQTKQAIHDYFMLALNSDAKEQDQ